MLGSQGLEARGPFVHGRIYRSEIHGRGRTIHHSHRLHQWVHIPDVCRHLSCTSAIGFGNGKDTDRHTNHDQPFGLLDTIFVSLRVPQGLDFDALGFLDLVGCTMADKNGLASPFDENLFLSVLTELLHCVVHTFFPSGIVERSTSTLAMARTSAEADMLTRKSASVNLSAQSSNWSFPSIQFVPNKPISPGLNLMQSI